MSENITIDIIDKGEIPEAEPKRQYYFMEPARKYVSLIAGQPDMAALEAAYRGRPELVVLIFRIRTAPGISACGK